MERELSAKLTEGLPYRSVDIRTNSTKISVDFAVGDTSDRAGTQKIISQVPFFPPLFCQGNQLLIAVWLQDNPSVTAGAVPPPFPQGRLAAKGLIAQFTKRCIEVRPFVLNGFCSAEQSEVAAINRWTVAFVSRIFLSFLLCAHEAVPMPASGWPKDPFAPYPQTRV